MVLKKLTLLMKQHLTYDVKFRYTVQFRKIKHS